jgi:hypothetical protein
VTPLTMQRIAFAAVCILPLLFLFWTAQAVRQKEIRIPNRVGGYISVQRDRHPIWYRLIVILYLAVTIIATGLVAMMAIGLR